MGVHACVRARVYARYSARTHTKHVLHFVKLKQSRWQPAWHSLRQAAQHSRRAQNLDLNLSSATVHLGDLGKSLHLSESRFLICKIRITVPPPIR